MSLATALALARQGFAVFPVVGKRPITPKGVYSASTDPRVFCCFDWGRGTDCAVATGAVSGIGVLDVDVRSAQPLMGRENSSCMHDGGVNGFVTLAQFGPLPETLAASTPNGGRHYWFRHVEGSRSRKLGAGIEWFSEKKLVVVPPAQGREWLNDADVVEAPDWLRELVLAPHNTNHDGCRGNSSGPLVANPNHSSIGPIGPTGQVPRQVYLLIVRGMRGAEPRLQRRVKGLWANLAAKRQHRNDGLNYTAWQLREFVKSGDLEQEVAGQLLWLACEANGYLAKDGPDVVKAVIHRVVEQKILATGEITR